MIHVTITPPFSGTVCRQGRSQAWDGGTSAPSPQIKSNPPAEFANFVLLEGVSH